MANGEFKTNVANLYEQQKDINKANTFYFTGIGAQTVPTGTLDIYGNLDPGSSPSKWESTPWKAGENGTQIINDAYETLKNRVSEILAENPNAQIDLNLTGFSRGSAEAVAFANLVNERGIPGLYAAGEVPINSMVLYDPVSQTSGMLNIAWPTNLSNPALVFVATAENRTWFPAMPVGADCIIVPVEGAHSDIGGSFNPDGISAVTLKIARDYLVAAGVPTAEIPVSMQPNWDRMNMHNSAIDNYGNVMMPTIGEPTVTVGSNRYYEGGGLGSITVKDMLDRDVKVTPIYQLVNGRYTLAGFNATNLSEVTNPDTGAVTRTSDTTAYARDGKTITGRQFESTTADSTGWVTDKLVVYYKADGVTITGTELTERLSNNNLLTTYRDGQGQINRTLEQQRFDDGSAISTTTYPSGRIEVATTDSTGAPSSKTVTTPTGNNIEQVDSYTYVNGKQVLSSSKTVEYFDDPDGRSHIDTVTTYVDGVATTVRNTYDADNNLFKTETLPTPVSSLTNEQSIAALNNLASLITAIQSGKPLPILTSGVQLLNTLTTGSVPSIANANSVLSGLSSLYNLHNTLAHSGNTLGKLNATLSTLNYVNSTLPQLISGPGTAVFSPALNGFLNGTGTGANGAFAGLGALARQTDYYVFDSCSRIFHAGYGHKMLLKPVKTTQTCRRTARGIRPVRCGSSVNAHLASKAVHFVFESTSNKDVRGNHEV